MPPTTEAPVSKQPPARAQEQPPARSPLPDVRDGRGAYLVAHGWTPLGHPDDPDTEWIDPTKPEKGSYRKVPRLAPHLNEDGSWSERQVMAQHGRGAEDKRPVVQTVYDPPGEPMSVKDAVREQRARDSIKAREEHAKR